MARSLERFLVVSFFALHGPAASAEAPLLSVSPRDAVLRVVDPTNGSTLSAGTTISLPGLTVNGATGLARHPQTGTLYALLRVQGRTNPELVTLNEVTGLAATLGNTSQRFASLAFASNGALYAVSGDGSAVPEALFTLNTSTANATLVTLLGNGSDGEALGFRPIDGLLYHASGIGNPNQPNNGEIFEKIDLGTLVVTNVLLSGYDYQEVTALVAAADGGFHAADVGQTTVDDPHFLHITASGVVTLVASLDHVSKGFAPVAACADGEDNDGDGLIDFVGGDPGCASPTDSDERAANLPCDNGLDDDGDGWVDYAVLGGDPGCQNPSSPIENPQCQDGLNNDYQIGTDFDGGISARGAGNGDPNGPDPHCTASWRNLEAFVSCGLGPELLPLLSALAMIRRLRRPSTRAV